ncbi:hypothetical protein F53441_9674 [Fusarium austroafricanum]|uniref:F-box domain-containing protein n=1 Tax=Fusarium austroafricanum TaxID=2364996 RepID=A0A8H4K8R6_9HYPO|nr:hypothetical protein F53441_9674 [Fusarium austroafricanum]
MTFDSDSVWPGEGGEHSEYDDKKKHQDAFLGATTYHRSIYYFPTIAPKLDRVPKSIGQYFESPLAPLGKLSGIPSDILEDIINLLDIKTFFNFRQVSRRARALATDIPLYQRVLAYGMEGLSALQRTGLTNQFSLIDLHNVLMSSECWICGDYGSFLFLPTCTRVCFDCLRSQPENVVVDEAKLRTRKTWKWIYEAHPREMEEALANMRSWRIHDWKDTRKMSKATRGVLASDLLAAYAKISGDEEDVGP